MRVLYVASLEPTSTASHRKLAFERLGHDVVGFDTSPYQSRGGALLSRLRLSTLMGPAVSRLNADLLEAARSARFDLAWFDKAIFVRRDTVRALREAGIRTIHYNVDNPFGPRGDPGWRLFLRAIPEYDLHAVQRQVNLEDYRRAGARDVTLMRTAYEPTVHFPPPASWSDAERPNPVTFIGTPYDDRAGFLTELWRRHGIPVRIWGTRRWRRVLDAEAFAAMVQGTEVWNDAYRETIWRSRICLGFVTHSNCDEVAHRSFEIAACSAFLLAEDTPGHRASFVDGEEAVLFSGVEDCAAKIRRYLPDEAARARIAAAGRRRAESSGYSNDAQIARVLAHAFGP